MKKNQGGIAHIFAILVIIVVAAVGVAGYKVVQSQKDKKNKDSAATSAPAATAEKAATWQKGDVAVKGEYADADVVKVDDTTWRLYYAIQPEVKGNNFEIYSATSSDGKSWKQDAGTRKTMATFPEVIKLKDGSYRMYFQSASVIKSAISSDGLSFKDEAGTRIDKSNPDNFVFDNVAAPTIMQQDDGTFVMIYRGTINTRYDATAPNATTQLLFWATSTDGLAFSKKGIAVDSRDTILRGQLDGPDIVMWDDGKYHAFVTSYSGVYEFTFDGTTFSKTTMAFAGEAKTQGSNLMGPPPGDPTVAKINGTWFMYYGARDQDSGIHYATLVE